MRTSNGQQVKGNARIPECERQCIGLGVRGDAWPVLGIFSVAQAEEKCRTFGDIILSLNKQYPQVSPSAAVRNQAYADVKRWLADFGLTPAVRSNMSLSSVERIRPSTINGGHQLAL